MNKKIAVKERIPRFNYCRAFIRWAQAIWTRMSHNVRRIILCWLSSRDVCVFVCGALQNGWQRGRYSL